MITLITLLSLLIMTCSIKSKLSVDSKCCEDSRTIIVTGTASVSLPSDLIKIKVAMETEENLATTSLKKNTEISRAVDKALKELGLKSSDISTTSFSINANYKSVYDRDHYKDVFDGYRVVNEIEIRLKELSFVGKTVDRVINAGATTIIGITFTNDDALIKKTKKELMSQALDDALEKVNLILVPLKLKIKEVLTIDNIDTYSEELSQASSFSNNNNNNNNNNNVSIPKVYANGNIVSASVSITFLIEKA
jgi:uncharacterized protein YggE